MIDSFHVVVGGFALVCLTAACWCFWQGGYWSGYWDCYHGWVDKTNLDAT